MYARTNTYIELFEEGEFVFYVEDGITTVDNIKWLWCIISLGGISNFKGHLVQADAKLFGTTQTYLGHVGRQVNGHHLNTKLLMGKQNISKDLAKGQA